MSWYSSGNQQQQTPKRGGIGPYRTITNAVTNAGLIRITATGHGFATNNKVNISGVKGTTEANRTGWVITVIDANTFDLVGSVFVNAYISGGQAILE